MSIQNFLFLTCACAALGRLFERQVGAHANKQAVVGSQAFRLQQDGSVGQWIRLQPCVGLVLGHSFRVSSPVEGGGG